MFQLYFILFSDQLSSDIQSPGGSDDSLHVDMEIIRNCLFIRETQIVDDFVILWIYTSKAYNNFVICMYPLYVSLVLPDTEVWNTINNKTVSFWKSVKTGSPFPEHFLNLEIPPKGLFFLIFFMRLPVPTKGAYDCSMNYTELEISLVKVKAFEKPVNDVLKTSLWLVLDILRLVQALLKK